MQFRIYFLLVLVLCACFSATGQTRGPVLLSPSANEVLDNGCQDKSDPVIWLFKWSEVPGAKRYHLNVMHAGSTYPVIDRQSVGIASFADYGESSYIAKHNLENWHWRVRAMVNGVWSEWSEDRGFTVEPLNTDCIGQVEAPVGAAMLTIPAQVYPANGAVFSNYPRDTVLLWENVLGAASYTVELDCFKCCSTDKWCTDVGTTWRVVPNIKYPAYKFYFVGAQPGRWRVWAVGANGEPGPKSEWSEFRYTQ